MGKRQVDALQDFQAPRRASMLLVQHDDCGLLDEDILRVRKDYCMLLLYEVSVATAVRKKHGHLP